MYSWSTSDTVSASTRATSTLRGTLSRRPYIWQRTMRRPRHRTCSAGTVLPTLRSLSRALAARSGGACPLVLTTRIREPLEYYLSFYRWAVGFRQRDNPTYYGRSFLEWVESVPNLQSTVMMRSMASYHAEYSPKRYRAMWVDSSRGATQQWQRLRAHLDRYSIVAPIARFDESMVLLHDLTGLPLFLYKRNRPRQKNGFRATSDEVCPDMEACRRAVRRVAERDHRMYARYARRFEAKLAALGAPFARRVEAYTRAVEGVQDVWKRVPRQQVLCRFQKGTVDPGRRPELHPSHIRCPFGAGPSSPANGAGGAHAHACSRVYAYRMFECPWQYRPNSTLTDAHGCWRPSSWVK